MRLGHSDKNNSFCALQMAQKLEVCARYRTNALNYAGFTHVLKHRSRLLSLANAIKSDHGSVSILLTSCNAVLGARLQSRIDHFGAWEQYSPRKELLVLQFTNVLQELQNSIIQKSTTLINIQPAPFFFQHGNSRLQGNTPMGIMREWKCLCY